MSPIPTILELEGKNIPNELVKAEHFRDSISKIGTATMAWIKFHTDTANSNRFIESNNTQYFGRDNRASAN